MTFFIFYTIIITSLNQLMLFMNGKEFRTQPIRLVEFLKKSAL